jgi:phosphotransferase family enzyme
LFASEESFVSMPTSGITVVDPRAGLDPSFTPPTSAVCLSEGKVYLLDGVVYRAGAPWTSSVNALLRHLEQVGYRGAPRLVGDGIDVEGRQVLRYVEGSLVHPYAWSDDAVVEVARLLRELHDATGSFVASHDAVWMAWYTHRPGADPVIGHGDVGPWNIIARDGMPVAFVDWDFAGPVERLDEVAEAIRLNCQLHGDDVAALRSLPSPQRRARQVAMFADAYGLSRDERAQVVDRMVEAAIRGCANDADEAVVTAGFVGPHPMVWGMAWQARGGRWILDHRGLLEESLGVRS